MWSLYRSTVQRDFVKVNDSGRGSTADLRFRASHLIPLAIGLARWVRWVTSRPVAVSLVVVAVLVVLPAMAAAQERPVVTQAVQVTPNPDPVRPTPLLRSP